MKRAYLHAILFFVVLACASHNNKKQSETNMQHRTITKQTGIVDFWQDLGKYTISLSVEGTIDSRLTCIVSQSDMLPQEFRKPGSKVVFSGTLTKDPGLPAPRMGGEEIFLLVKLNDIKLSDNN